MLQEEYFTFGKEERKKKDMSLRLHNQPKIKYSILESFVERLSIDEFVEDDMFEFGKSDNHGYYIVPCMKYEHYNYNDQERFNNLSCYLQNRSKSELK